MSRFHIIPSIIDGPFGGGNQFANALRTCWRTQGIYSEQLDNAEILIFNGFPFRNINLFLEAAHWKKRDPVRHKIIARIDGPIAVIRNSLESDKFDRALYHFSEMVADGIIAQSQWSLEQILSHPDAPSRPIAVIGNAVNQDIFFPAPTKENDNNKDKFRIIATSWSDNPQKGYPIYAWLDENLDYTKYSFTLVGRTNYQFKNVEQHNPVEQSVLADILRNHDAYITASTMEACSNALLEALHCGLPCIAPNSSSHPEYISNHDLLFDVKEDIPNILQTLSDNFEAYKSQINVASMESIAARYVEFSQSVQAVRDINIEGLKQYLQENEFIPSGIGALKQKLKTFGKRIVQGG